MRTSWLAAGVSASRRAERARARRVRGCCNPRHIAGCSRAGQPCAGASQGLRRRGGVQANATRPTTTRGRTRTTSWRCSRQTRRQCKGDFQATPSSPTPARRRRSRRATASTSSAPTARTASSRISRSSYTFGVDPLQQYLIELPGGRLQALGIAWDTRPKAQGGQRWFHLYPGPEPARGRSAALDRRRPELELHVRRVPLDARCARTSTRQKRTLRHDVGGDRRRVRGVPRPGRRSRREGAGGQGRQGVRAPPTTASRSRSTSARASPGRRCRQPATRSAARRARRRARSTRARAATRAPRASRTTYVHGKPLQDTHRLATPRRTASTGTTARSATRSTNGARSCRARCTRRASPARIATIRTRWQLRRPGNDVCAQCHQPAKYDAARAHAPREGHARRRMRRLPHADDDVHGRRCAPRSFAAHPAPRPLGDARHAERVQQLPREARRRSGRRTRFKSWTGQALRPASRRSATRCAPATAARRARAGRCMTDRRRFERSRRSRARARSSGWAACSRRRRCRRSRARSTIPIPSCGSPRSRRSAAPTPATRVRYLPRMLNDPVRRQCGSRPRARWRPRRGAAFAAADRGRFAEGARRVHRRADLQRRSARRPDEPRQSLRRRAATLPSARSPSSARRWRSIRRRRRLA